VKRGPIRISALKRFCKRRYCALSRKFCQCEGTCRSCRRLVTPSVSLIFGQPFPLLSSAWSASNPDTSSKSEVDSSCNAPYCVQVDFIALEHSGKSFGLRVARNRTGG